jgi:hypothetical protein
VLEDIPSSADILIHLDIDVLAKQDMPRRKAWAELECWT